MALIKDSEWVRQAFLVKSDELSDAVKVHRNYCSARIKYVDGTPGGNICINPLPQACIYTDPPPDGSHSLRVGSSGLGSLYSEIFDDNKQVIHMRFGVPAYNSLRSWWGGFYNVDAGQLARTGRASPLLFTIGRAIGFVVSLIAWPLHAFSFLYRMARYFLEMPSSKFYYLKPTMINYWSAVQNIVNHIAVNSGLTLTNMNKDEQGNPMQPKGGLEENYANDDVLGKLANLKLHQAYPDVVSERGYIDVYAIAGRAQRLINKQDLMLKNMLNGELKDQAFGNLNTLKERMMAIWSTRLENRDPDFRDYADKWFNSSAGRNDPAIRESAALEQAQASEGTSGYNESNGTGWLGEDSWFRILQKEWDDGNAFASFRVNYTGAVSESFSNEFRESAFAEKINSISSESRTTRIDLSGGNIGDGPISDLVETAISGVSTILAGIGQEIGMQGIAILGGAAFADIPKHWDRASASFPRSTYVMELVSPDNSVISQVTRLYIPTAMALATVLPLSTGKSSHTSPFLCEYYDKGRCQTRLGMVRQLTIERGGLTNIGFSRTGRALSIKITMEIEDMSSIMAMPINEGFTLTKGAIGRLVETGVGLLTGGNQQAQDIAAAAIQGNVFDDSTFFSDYMNILGSTSLRSQTYRFANLRRILALNAYQHQQIYSRHYQMGLVADVVPGFMAQAWFHGNGRLE